MTKTYSLKDIVQRAYVDTEIFIECVRTNGQPFDYNLTIDDNEYEAEFSSGNRSELKNRINELMLNSLKAMLGIKSPGDVTNGGYGVSINDETPRIDLDIRIQNDEYVLSVSDNGPGINPGVLPNIFNYGFSTFGTTGYGLFEVKETVEKFGGRIEVESMVGVGTTFTIYLPKNN